MAFRRSPVRSRSGPIPPSPGNTSATSGGSSSSSCCRPETNRSSASGSTCTCSSWPPARASEQLRNMRRCSRELASPSPASARQRSDSAWSKRPQSEAPRQWRSQSTTLRVAIDETANDASDGSGSGERPLQLDRADLVSRSRAVTRFGALLTVVARVFRSNDLRCGSSILRFCWSWKLLSNRL